MKKMEPGSRKYKIISIILIILSVLSFVLYFLFNWPLLFFLFIPGFFFAKKPRPRPDADTLCNTCRSAIDPKWKYCPFCSSKI